MYCPIANSEAHHVNNGYGRPPASHFQKFDKIQAIIFCLITLYSKSETDNTITDVRELFKATSKQGETAEEDEDLSEANKSQSALCPGHDGKLHSHFHCHW